MDCAKAIGLMSSNERDVLDFEGVDEVALPGPPLVCVPTTAGTAADVSQFAIINATQRKTKIAIVSKKAIPDAALIDPAVTVTMDAGLTAATGMDALTHAMEAYVSKASSPITDLDALEAIRLVARFLQRAVADGTDREAREGMMLASLLAGLAFSNAGLGIVHAMAHALGGELDLPHGLCNALLLEASVRFNFSAAVDRYRKTAIALADGIAGRFSDLSPTAAIRIDSNESVRSELSSLLLRLRAEVGLSGGLGAYGLTGDAIHAIAHKAYWDSCLATNPREVEPADLEAIYAETL
jgi:alcohol dehydrogenase class IV